MRIKNKHLLSDLQSANIILESGNINTRWKIMIEKVTIKKYKSRLELFSDIWEYPSPHCCVCEQPTDHTFGSPNFIKPVKMFSKVCSSRCNRKLKSAALSNIRNDAGKDKLRAEKFKKTVSGIGITGKKISSEISIKAAITKRATIVNGKTLQEWQTIKCLNTKVLNGSILSPDKVPPFHSYRKLVHKLSARENISVLENFENRGHYNNGGFHLDHIVSIRDGYKLNIPPEIIANLVNLRFIPAIDNTTKCGRSDMLIPDLFKKYHMFAVLKCDLSFVSEYAKS